MIMMKTGFRIMAALLLAAALWTAAIADSARVSTGGGKLNMRKNPEDKAKILTTIKNGESVEVTETELEMVKTIVGLHLNHFFIERNCRRKVFVKHH